MTVTGPLTTLRIAALLVALVLAITAGWLLGAPDRTPLPRAQPPSQTVRLGALERPVAIPPLRPRG